MANPKQINANYRKTERLLEENPTPIDVGISETIADYVGEEISDLAKDDLSNVDFGSENVGKSLMVDADGGIEVGNPSFTPGTSGVVVPDTPATGANAVNKNYVDSLNIGTSADESSSSGSLWARIKYALANMVGLSGNQTVAGTKTFSSSPVVPTTPDTTTSAVNQAYVESTVDGVNDLVHKSGNESISGIKTFSNTLIRKSSIPESPDDYIEARLAYIDDATDAQLYYTGVGKTSTSTSSFIGVKGAGAYYSKLIIRLNRETGKVDLILESNTQDGYEQHIIYTFGS